MAVVALTLKKTSKSALYATGSRRIKMAAGIN